MIVAVLQDSVSLELDIVEHEEVKQFVNRATRRTDLFEG